MYGLTALNVAVFAIPVFFILWTVLKPPVQLRTSHLAFAGFLGATTLIYGVYALIILAGMR